MIRVAILKLPCVAPAAPCISAVFPYLDCSSPPSPLLYNGDITKSYYLQMAHPSALRFALVPIWLAVAAVQGGTITTIVGNGGIGFSGEGSAGTSAELQYPIGVAVDTAGNAYIADVGNHRIRKWTASTGIFTTIAGTGNAGFNGDGGAATSAELNWP